MKILLFTPMAVECKSATKGYNGGGWISSIVEQLQKQPDVELAVSFVGDGDAFRIEENGVIYYPVRKYRKPFWQRIGSKFGIGSFYIERKTWPFIQRLLKAVVDDFQPDIIEVFGSESFLGLVAEITKVPVVLHVQGVLNPYFNALCPPGVSLTRFYFEDFNPSHVKKRMDYVRFFKINCMRERFIVGKIKHFIGRTSWDQRIVATLNPGANYYYGGEILRDIFYKDYPRTIPVKPTFVSIVSQPMYKGVDVILKTANILKNFLRLDFDWLVYGVYSSAAAEKREKVKGSDVNVIFSGVATPEKLVESLINCTVYVHPSYIDNSPNSLCEAQMLGCACVATNVGGVPSLIENGKNGFLVPSNDPYQMAFLLNWLSKNTSENAKMGRAAKETALYRHSKERIVEQLVNTFKEIISND